MATRRQYIERILRQVYGGFPTDDSEITDNLVNQWLNDALGAAAKLNYTESIRMDGIAYINNSFYSTFKNIQFSKDSLFVYSATLPQVPIGLGRNEGINDLRFRMPDGSYSYSALPLSQNQKGYFDTLPPIPNKILYWYEGNQLYAKSTLPLNTMSTSLTMISGGDSSDLNSIINVPDEYFDFITQYIQKNLILERNQPDDVQNDGADFIRSN